MSEKFQSELNVWEAAISKATDSVYGILISHLYAEHLIDRYIKATLPQEDGLTGKDRLTFSDKIKLIKSLGGFDQQTIDSLRKLNGIRNNCAHVFGHEITESEVESYGRTLGNDYKRIREKYPDAGTHGIAPISWHVVGSVLSFVAAAEGWPVDA